MTDKGTIGDRLNECINKEIDFCRMDDVKTHHTSRLFKEKHGDFKIFADVKVTITRDQK